MFVCACSSGVCVCVRACSCFCLWCVCLRLCMCPGVCVRAFFCVFMVCLRVGRVFVCVQACVSDRVCMGVYVFVCVCGCVCAVWLCPVGSSHSPSTHLCV